MVGARVRGRCGREAGSARSGGRLVGCGRLALKVARGGGFSARPARAVRLYCTVGFPPALVVVTIVIYRTGVPCAPESGWLNRVLGGWRGSQVSSVRMARWKPPFLRPWKR